ncbi:MAG TPA: DUF211 domain-containing protein, partial [Gammaproteobacteria bacterium]
DLDFEAIQQAIKALGGSLHSIDEIETGGSGVDRGALPQG